MGGRVSVQVHNYPALIETVHKHALCIVYALHAAPHFRSRCRYVEKQKKDVQIKNLTVSPLSTHSLPAHTRPPLQPAACGQLNLPFGVCAPPVRAREPVQIPARASRARGRVPPRVWL